VSRPSMHVVPHAPRLSDAPLVCCREAFAIYAIYCTRMAIMRQYVSLSGSHGVQNLAMHFQGEFLPAWKSMFEGGGHSLGSAALDILCNAQWMKPSAALNYGKPAVDLAALSGQRTGAATTLSSSPSKSTLSSSKETQGEAAPYGSWRVRIGGRWRQGAGHIGFAQYTMVLL
jgi:hypothetical protein